MEACIPVVDLQLHQHQHPLLLHLLRASVDPTLRLLSHREPQRSAKQQGFGHCLEDIKIERKTCYSTPHTSQRRG